MNRGDVARHWMDALEEKIPLKDKFPMLFDICVEPNCIVDKISNMNHVSSFRRRLPPELMQQWGEVKKDVQNLIQNELPDEVYWGLDNTRKYTTKSMYRWLEKDLAGSCFKWIWEACMPLKI